MGHKEVRFPSVYPIIVDTAARPLYMAVEVRSPLCPAAHVRWCVGLLSLRIWFSRPTRDLHALRGSRCVFVRCPGLVCSEGGQSVEALAAWLDVLASLPGVVSGAALPAT
jgi:hypothetical protein